MRSTVIDDSGAGSFSAAIASKLFPASRGANLFGVAAKTAAEGESVEIATVGVYELPKLVSAVIAAGARVAWDDTAKQVVLPGTGKVPIGIATLMAGNGATMIRVRLDGVATQVA